MEGPVSILGGVSIMVGGHIPQPEPTDDTIRAQLTLIC